ncbi:MAG TPA: efflux RND transporter periplasmic adaptor subunit [Chromatiales bacterium]|nr:efflux RND transporter periplasmic adaptor subunit [Chromatiales bacterium]
MRHLIKFGLIFLVATAIVAVWWLTRPEPVKVVVAQVGRGDVESMDANTRAGTVKACRRAGISPATGGQIVRLTVKEGDHVEAGQLLLELWNEDLQARVALAQSEVKAAGSRRDATCLNAQVARREANRLKRLRQSNAVSAEAVDKAETSARAQHAECKAAEASISVAGAKLGLAKAGLERTRLEAPFAGVVAQVNGELMEYVTPSPVGVITPPAIDLIDPACFYVKAPIDEVDAPGIEVGMPVRITMDAFGERVFSGKVRRIADYVLDLEKQARTLDIDVAFTEVPDDVRLLAGYSADVEIILQTVSNVVKVSTPAVLDGNRVFVFHPQRGVLEERQVDTGVSNWDFTEVRSGLKPDEWVVTSVDRAGVEDGAAAVKDTESP